VFKQNEWAARAAGLTVGDMLDAQVAAQPQAIALQAGTARWTYADLAARVDQYSGMLLAEGVRPGDCIAILAENRVEYVMLVLAAARLGVATACLNWRQATAELEHCVRLVTPALAVVSPRYEGRIDLLRAQGVGKVLTFGDAFDRLVDAMPAVRAAVAPPDAEAILIVIYTSGTTGMPKGAALSHRAMVARGVVGIMDKAYPRGTTFIAWPPMFHTTETEYSLTTLMSGGRVIVMDGFQLEPLVDLITTEDNLGWIQLMPGMSDRVLDELKRRGARPKPVACIGSAPDLVPRHKLAEATLMFNAPYRNTFGSTEAGPICAPSVVPVGVAPDDLSKQLASLFSARFVDEDGRDVASDEPGEMLLRGPTLFSGYWGMPEATAEAFADGWFHTGDVFVRTAEGRVNFVDRRKYLIKSGGENIYPAEIEKVLLASPRIDEAVVVRKPDPKWGEVPVAFVVRKDTTLTEQDVIDMCRGQIANYKLPRHVRFIGTADIQRNPTGKAMRHLLEERLAAEGG